MPTATHAPREEPPSFDADGIPARVGRYEVLREIGHGGMARVFEGRHIDLDKRVAVKLLPTRVAADDPRAARFLEEGRAAARIRHPNVVAVVDVGFEAGVPFLVMELLEGMVLTRHLERAGKLAYEQAIDTIVPVISAVAAAHAVGVIHRDLKPDNVMLCQRRQGDVSPTVLDFGISKRLDMDRELLTASGIVIGTVPYLAPEQTRGAKFGSALSDQYAVAVILYECITGRRPFEGEGVYETMHAIVTASIPAPSELAPGVPAGLDAVVLRALARDPAKRFPCIRSFGAALLPFAATRTRAAWALDLEPLPEPLAPIQRDPVATSRGSDHAERHPSSRAGLETSTGTAHALPIPTERELSAKVRPSRAIGGARRLARPLAIVAAVAALAGATLSIRRVRAREAAAAASSAVLAAAPAPEPASPAPSTVPVPTIAAPPPPVPTSSANPNARSNARRGPPAPNVDPLVRGTNGAPIFD